MNNKVFIVLSCLICVTLNAEAITVDMTSFVKQREKSLKSQRVKHELQKQRVKEIVELEKKNIPNVEDDKNSVSVCNCDDPNDPYNYSSNFLYDVKKIKTHRINPYCKCKKNTGFIAEKETSEGLEGKYKWNIRY